MEWFSGLSHPMQAFLATLMTWSVTAAGAACVFFFRSIGKTAMDAMLGFAAGVMVSASFWSLLLPGIDLSRELGMNPWLTASAGFLGGGFLLFLGDRAYDRWDARQGRSAPSRKRCLMLIGSITLHNIPEGMVVGVAFGSLAYGLDGATTASALMLSVGIALQNFPEGLAVSVPLRREGCSPSRAFFVGQLSGLAEPISGVLGAMLALRIRALLPILLSFAAGAMIYVVVEELIPESQTNCRKEWMALFTLVGFTVMMILDVAFG